MNRCLVWSLGITLSVCCASSARAAWPTDLSANVAVDTIGGASAAVVADGVGGVFVAWEGYREGGGSTVFAQHYNSEGAAAWPLNGLPVALDAAPGQQMPQLLPDGAGGVFVAWRDWDPTSWADVYAQHITASGALQWGAAGKVVCHDLGSQALLRLMPDGSGGVIIGWYGSGVFGQRFNAGGVPQWGTNGVALCPVDLSAVQLNSDGAGGVLAVWSDASNLRAQRYDDTGAPIWANGGVAICSVSGDRQDLRIACDGAGGFIVAWTDTRNGPQDPRSRDVYMQRLSSSGAAQWAVDGVPVCTAEGWQSGLGMVSDDAGGAILAWTDERQDSLHVYAQRVDAGGNTRWQPNGIGLFVSDALQMNAKLVPDGGGGAVIAWMDHRRGHLQIWAQRLAADGSQAWGTDGRALSNLSTDQACMELAADGAGGAVAVWLDSRACYSGIYAQGVPANGWGAQAVAEAPPNVANSIELASAGANPSRGGSMLVRLGLLGDEPSVIEVMDVAGRRVMSRSLSAVGAGVHSMDLANGSRLAAGVYLVRLREGTRVRTIRMVRLD